MSLAPGFAGPVHLCRRLFCEPTHTLVQQTLEAVMRRDQERFNKVWNFPIPPIRHADATTRQPLTSKNANPCESESQSAPISELGNTGWRLFQPEASFYTTPPRKLKAYRRLHPSVAQKTRWDINKIQTHDTLVTKDGESVGSISETDQQSSGEPVSVVSEASIHSRVPQIASTSSMVIRSRPVTPILICPSTSEEPPRLPYLEHLKSSANDSCQSSPAGHKITLIRSRHSEHVIKRRSGAKVTDYFAVSKRPRQSLK